MLPATEAPVAISLHLARRRRPTTVALLSSKRLMSALGGAILVELQVLDRAARHADASCRPGRPALLTASALGPNTAWKNGE